MNDLQRYTPPTQIVPAGQHQTDVLANHAAADALIGRLLATIPVRPRDHERVLARIRNEALAGGQDFFYAWDVKTKGGGKSEVSGPSIELAMAIANAVGNCGYVTTHIETADAWVMTAYLVDCENGIVHGRQFRQRREQRTFSNSRRDQDLDRQQDIAFQIGQSKAIRNVIVRAFKPYVDYALREARKVLIATVTKDLTRSKERVAARLAELSVPVDRVSRWVGSGPEQWKAEDLVKIFAALTAVNEGLTTAQELWPDPLLAAGPPPAPRPPAREEPPPHEPPADMPDAAEGPDPNQDSLPI